MESVYFHWKSSACLECELIIKIAHRLEICERVFSAIHLRITINCNLNANEEGRQMNAPVSCPFLLFSFLFILYANWRPASMLVIKKFFFCKFARWVDGINKSMRLKFTMRIIHWMRWSSSVTHQFQWHGMFITTTKNVKLMQNFCWSNFSLKLA